MILYIITFLPLRSSPISRITKRKYTYLIRSCRFLVTHVEDFNRSSTMQNKGYRVNVEVTQE